MGVTLQLPYREARDGFWGTQTSTLNWCEEDYNVTFWMAETVNTLTNVIFLVLGMKGIQNCLKYAHPPVFVVAYVGYMVVGLGSMAFHGTMQYSMQLADELPMIYTTCIMVYATFSYGRSRGFALILAASLLLLAIFITAYYHYTKNPDFHQNCYTILTCIVVFRGMHLMESVLRPALRKRGTEHLMKKTWLMAATGVGYFLTGFLLWTIDNIYCDYLRKWRAYVLLPWAVLLEGHGWWHLLTAVGAYYLITWRIWVVRCLDGDERYFDLKFTNIFTSVPKVVRVSGDDAATNGSAKKLQ